MWILVIGSAIALGLINGTAVYKSRTKPKGNPFGEMFIWLLHVVLFSILFFFVLLAMTWL